MDASYIRDQVQRRAGCFPIHTATIRGLLLPGIFFLGTRAFCHGNLERAKPRGFDRQVYLEFIGA